MDERQVRFRSGDIELAGTLSVPPGSGPFPAMVLFHGSSALDRDENPDPALAGDHVRGLRLDVFKEIAGAFAASGVAVLRYDKRGVGGSGGDFVSRTLSDLVGDATAAVAFVRTCAEVDAARVGVLGHSEGALLAAIVASRDPNVAGVVSCAGVSTGLYECMRFQAEARARSMPDDDVMGEFDAMCARIRAGRDTQMAGQPVSGAWVREWWATDVPAVLAAVRCPVLVVQGDKDCQVAWPEAVGMTSILRAAGNPDVELALFANVDHLLKFEPEISTAARYQQLGSRPTEPGVLATITAWAQRVLVRGEPPARVPGQGFAGALDQLGVHA